LQITLCHPGFRFEGQEIYAGTAGCRSFNVCARGEVSQCKETLMYVTRRKTLRVYAMFRALIGDCSSLGPSPALEMLAMLRYSLFSGGSFTLETSSTAIFSLGPNRACHHPQFTHVDSRLYISIGRTVHVHANGRTASSRLESRMASLFRLGLRILNERDIE